MKEIKTIYIAADHAGFELKKQLINHLNFLDYEVIDLGTNSAEQSVDYPDYADKLADALLKETSDTYGVLICGSGIGISIAANRHRHIRAALCRSAEDAQLAREHNDANVLVLGGRITDEKTAILILDIFIAAQFTGGRHLKRVEKLG